MGLSSSPNPERVYATRNDDLPLHQKDRALSVESGPRSLLYLIDIDHLIRCEAVPFSARCSKVADAMKGLRRQWAV